jgi:hypothetical protein
MPLSRLAGHVAYSGEKRMYTERILYDRELYNSTFCLILVGIEIKEEEK